MARRRRSDPLGLKNIGATLNLTPLLDIIFNLIFFFILATNIRERDRFLEITLPSSTTAEARPAEKEIPRVTMTREGDLFFKGEKITAEGLAVELKMAAEDGAEEVILASDGQLAWQRIIDVTDICREAGILQVTPMIRNEETPPAGPEGQVDE
ncbi:biopolymer transporter ExbD [bacterium]|nr:biopolymer transporter ExbD [bacterium]